MIFQFYSYALVETQQMSLGLYPKTQDKPALLNKILAEKLSEKEFKYKSSILGFLLNNSTGNNLLCTLGKKSTSTIVHSPRELFKEEHKEDWKRCGIFFSLDPKAQYLAFEYKPYIFTAPLNQLNALAQEINYHLLDQSYEIVFKPVLKEQAFWDVVTEYQGRIEKVQFDYVAPNFLDTTASIHKGLKEAKEKMGITGMSITFENKEGHLSIPIEDKNFKENVEEATKGGGSIHIKAKGKTIYSSENNKNVKTVDIDISVELESNSNDTINKALKSVFACLD